MENSQRIEELLVEIRDLQKDILAEYQAQAARGVALAEESVERQRRFGVLYQRVLIVGGVLIVGAISFLIWAITSGGS